MRDALDQKLRFRFEQMNRSVAVKETDDLVAVDIFFSTMEQNTVTTSETTPIFIFISNIGGQLGY